LKLLSQIKGKEEKLRIPIRTVEMDPTVGEAQVMKGMLFYLYSVTPFTVANIN